MKNRSILTSLVALAFAAPVMAATDVNQFPDPDLSPEARQQGVQMLANRVYLHAATASNMDGVYEDSATVYAIAVYKSILYNVVPGTYLPQSGTEVQTCTSGYYCPGVTSEVVYDTTQAQGLETCPDGYSSSDGGAFSQNQCYRSCDSANMGQNGSVANIAHAATITGKDYYGGTGTGYDTCEAATCLAGWHMKEHVSGSVLQAKAGTAEGLNSAYLGYPSGDMRQYNAQGSSHDSTYYGFVSSEVGNWVVEYASSRFVYGSSRCSSAAGTNNNNTWTNPTKLTNGQMTATSSGKYCYCNVTGYREAGALQSGWMSPWVYVDAFDSTGSCDSSCAYYCSNYMRSTGTADLAFRASLLGSAYIPASCEPNTIKVKWYGTTLQAVNDNNAGTVTYGGDVYTPSSYIERTGYEFQGWRFSNTPPAEGTPANPD